MFALLTMPHWIGTTGHVLYVLWPWVATAAAALMFAVALQMGGELSKMEDRLHDAERLNAVTARTQNNGALQVAYQTAREWEQRYYLQLQKCEVEHVERPLPTMIMSAVDKEELDGLFG